MNKASSLWSVAGILVAMGAAPPEKNYTYEGAPADAKHGYSAIVRRYADAMVDQAGGKHGAMAAPLFASCLDRRTLAFPAQLPAAPKGVRPSDRVAPTASNPQHDQALYLLLYRMTEATGEKRYAEAADAALRWFLTRAQSPNTGLYAWGEHLSWDIVDNTWRCTHNKKYGSHEMCGPWELSDRCYRLAPESFVRFGRGLWEHQIGDRETGNFSRHAGYAEHRPSDDEDYQRHAGYFIQTWADLFALTKDPSWLKSIEVLLARYERKRNPQTGIVPGGASIASTPDFDFSATFSSLSLAVSCEASAAKVPAPLAGRLRDFAVREDAAFCGLPHFPAASGSETAAPGDLGFVCQVNAKTGKPWPDDAAQARSRPSRTFSSPWQTAYGSTATAERAGLCIDRYRQTRKPEYLQLIVKSADAYRTGSWEAAQVDLWPSVPAAVMRLLVAAYQETGKTEYLGRARHFADEAVKIFWDHGPLPRASSRTEHYETITGGPDLALALWEFDESAAKGRNPADRGIRLGQ